MSNKKCHQINVIKKTLQSVMYLKVKYKWTVLEKKVETVALYTLKV